MPNPPYNTEGLPPIQAGAAQTVITPPLGVSLAGYFHDRIAKRVRDDLFCRAAVFAGQTERIALVSCDLISVERETVGAAKALISNRVGIRPEHVLICATHTHTGPETRPGRLLPVCASWLAELPGRIALAVELANQSLAPAVLFAGRQAEARLGSNRLGRKKDGSEIFGKQDVIGPAGGIDPELLALSVRDVDGTVRAMVVNYAMHPDVIGGGSGDFISADWPGELARAVAGVYGPQAVTLLLNGTCGDINHARWETTRQPRGGPAKSVQMGRALAGLAVEATETAEPLDRNGCAGALQHVDIPYYTRDAQFAAEVEQLRRREKLSDFEQYIVRTFDSWPFDGKTASVPVQALRLGSLVFTGLPGEVFSHWGLEIKHWSPGTHTFVAELANDWFGYIPTSDQAHRGAYGAKPILSRRLEADAGRKMADAIQVLMWKLWG